MSTRSGRIRTSVKEPSPPRTRPSRSPARSRKISPAEKSPSARQTARKSPARKSPSRKTPSKFPARKSPARTTKEPVETSVPEVPKSPVKRPAIKPNHFVRLEEISAKIDSLRSARSKRIEYSKEITSTTSEFIIEKVNGVESITDNYGLRNRRSVEEVAPRRSSRLREFIENVPNLPDIRRSLSKSLSQKSSASKSLGKSSAYSDEENSADEFIKEKSRSVTRKLSTPLPNTLNNIKQIANCFEFGGRVGSAALIILIPLTVLSILTSCMKSCSFNTLLNFSPFKSLLLWFSIPATVTVVTQYVLQAVFTVTPVLGTWGKRMDGSNTEQCFNAPIATLITLGLFNGLDFYKIIDKSALLGDYLKLATVSYILAVLLSIVLYVKSRKADKSELNPNGNTGYLLYDFFMGREIHPQLKGLDLKIWLSRICNINTLFLATLIHSQSIKLNWNDGLDLNNYKEFLNKVQWQPTVFVYSLMQLVYALSFILKEYRITSTFYWQYEGLGYMQVVSHALYPFYFMTVSKYIVDTNLVLSTNVLITAVVLFVLGFSVMLASNNIKYEFRRDPLQAKLSHLEAMPTFHGKKLITSGLWGLLRHPNYAGDIIIHIAIALPGLISGEIIAASPALITILVLLHRALRDHTRCKSRYGSAWQRYCKKVPSVIIPKVL